MTKINKMKKGITKENLESFGVQCPSDYKTNQKWQDIIKAFDEITNNLLSGSCTDYYYGKTMRNGFDFSEYTYKFNKILSIDEVWEYFYGEEFKEGDEVICFGTKYKFFQYLPEFNGTNSHSENCLLVNEFGYYITNTSKLTKVNTKRIQEIEQQMKELSNELKQLQKY